MRYVISADKTDQGCHFAWVKHPYRGPAFVHWAWNTSTLQAGLGLVDQLVKESAEWIVLKPELEHLGKLLRIELRDVSRQLMTLASDGKINLKGNRWIEARLRRNIKTLDELSPELQCAAVGLTLVA